MRILCTLLVLLFSGAAHARSTPVIWNGSKAKVITATGITDSGGVHFVTSNNAGTGERIERLTGACQATSAHTTRSGTSIALGNISAGTCSITFAAGVFSAAPTCVISTNQNTPSSVFMSSNTTSATAGTVSCYTGSAACSSFGFNLVCVGPR